MTVVNRKTLYYLFFVLNTRWGCSLEDLKILLDQINWYEPSRAPLDGYNSARKIFKRQDSCLGRRTRFSTERRRSRVQNTLLSWSVWKSRQPHHSPISPVNLNQSPMCNLWKISVAFSYFSKL